MRLSIDLPDEMHRELKAKAAGQGQTISEVVRSAVDSYLKGNYTLGHPGKVATEAQPKGTTKEEWDDSLAAVRFKPISKADQAKGRSRK